MQFPPPQNLTVEQTDYTLGAFEKRTATAAFSAKGDWTLSIVYDDAEAGDETDADAAWLTADAAGRAGRRAGVPRRAVRDRRAPGGRPPQARPAAGCPAACPAEQRIMKVSLRG